MIHIVHDRPTMHAKAFDDSRSQIFDIVASGDAWGDGSGTPYGHDYPIPPGHYMLGEPAYWVRFDLAEGWGQIPMTDMSVAVIDALVKAGKAERVGEDVKIGGITLPVGQLAKYGRADIFVHGGGSNLGMPAAQDPDQQLCKTEGCTRVHNEDWQMLADRVARWLNGNVVVWSAVGDPEPLSL